VDLSDGLMGTNTSDKNKGGMPRTQKSMEQGRTGGVGGVHRNNSSGDKNSEGEREQIPTKKTKTGVGETRTSTKGPPQKGGPRKSQSDGDREEDNERRRKGELRPPAKRWNWRHTRPQGAQKSAANTTGVT